MRGSCLLLVSGLAMGQALSAPLTLTFRGKVAEIDDSAHIAGRPDLKIGDSVEYRFRIDREKPGTAYFRSGKTIRYNAGFYADFLGDPVLPDPDSGSGEDAAHPERNGDRVLEFNRGGMDNALKGNGSDHGCEVRMITGSWEKPAIGDSLTGLESVRYRIKGVEKSALVKSGLKLVSIAVP